MVDCKKTGQPKFANEAAALAACGRSGVVGDYGGQCVGTLEESARISGTSIPSRRYVAYIEADLIIPEGINQVALDVLTARVAQLCGQLITTHTRSGDPDP